MTALENPNEPLTSKQIENWRNILLGMVGPYALLLTDAEIQQYRDKMQQNFNAVEPQEE